MAYILLHSEDQVHKCPGQESEEFQLINEEGDFPGGAVVKNPPSWTSLVVQWLRIRLPMQGTQVRSLVQ